MFCGILEGKNAESSADDAGLACGISEGSVNTLSGPFVILIKDSVILDSWG